METKYIILQYDFNLKYAFQLVSDVADDQMAYIPSSGLQNHPAFTLGHLVSGSAGLAEDLGGTFEMPEGWDALFLRKGPGDPRLPHEDRQLYPAKALLLEELNQQHEKVKRLLSNCTEVQLRQPVKWRFNHYFPTLLDLVVFMAVTHEAMHLGQLAAWRRAIGLPSALAAL